MGEENNIPKCLRSVKIASNNVNQNSWKVNKIHSEIVKESILTCKIYLGIICLIKLNTPKTSYSQSV